MKNKLFLASLVITTLALSSCGIFDSITYKPDVQQGNVWSEENIKALHPGMTKDKVIELLGSPMIAKGIPDTMDYVHTTQNRKELTIRRLHLIFKDGQLQSPPYTLTETTKRV